MKNYKVSKKGTKKLLYTKLTLIYSSFTIVHSFPKSTHQPDIHQTYNEYLTHHLSSTGRHPNDKKLITLHLLFFQSFPQIILLSVNIFFATKWDLQSYFYAPFKLQFFQRFICSKAYLHIRFFKFKTL